MPTRLNKYLASLGIASRRKIDQLISQGRVKVNDKPATLGQKVSEVDTIKIDDKLIKNFSTKYTYLILNKPLNVLTTTKDDRGRTTVLDLVSTNQRLFPVGRLDYQSTGLVILTNDGTLTNLITHPKYHLPKVYLVDTDSQVKPFHLNKIRLEAKVKIANNYKNITTLEITLYQGLKRQIRYMFRDLGLNLLSLHRISIGPINIGKLKAGQSRFLSKSEIQTLKNLNRL